MKWSETIFKIINAFDPKNHPIYALLAMMVISLTIISIIVVAGVGGKGLAVATGITGRALASMITVK